MENYGWKILAYADDLVLLAEKTAIGRQKTGVEEVLDWAGLSVNPNKSSSFSLGTKKDIVYKYLGIYFSSKEGIKYNV